MKIDLHNHSYYSDGFLSPQEVVSLAHNAGCKMFSLTDHDSTEGVSQAKIEADKLGILVFGNKNVTDMDHEVVMSLMDMMAAYTSEATPFKLEQP